MNIILVDSLIDNDYTLYLCDGLSKAGAKVNLVVPENRSIKKNHDFTINRWAPSKKRNKNKILKTLGYIKYLSRLTIFIFESKNKLVHFQFFRRERLDSVYYYLLNLIGVTLIYTAHNILPHDYTKMDPWFRKLVYNASSVIIVHSEYIKKELTKQFGINENKVHVIAHGNFDSFLPEKPMKKEQAREFFNIKEDTQVILFFGRILNYKGLDHLLEAFEEAASQNQNLFLLVGGSLAKGEKPFYENILKGMNHKERVIFNSNYIPGEEIPYYFYAADVIVLPYKNIYHSGVIHLALPFGKPIIASCVGDFPEVIEHKRTGYLTEPNNPKKLAECILSALSDKAGLEKMANEIKNQNHYKYSWMLLVRIQ